MLLLGLAWSGVNAAIFGNGLWLPQIVKSLGYSNLTTGFIISLPYLLGIPIMLLVARSSDRRGERVWHTAVPLLVAAGGFAVAAVTQNPFVVMAGLFAVVWGLVGTYGPYYSLASSFFAGPAAPGAIALVNLMCTGLGGFLGPNIVGLLKQGTGGYAAGMLALAACLVISVIILLLVGRVIAARRTVLAGA